MPRVSFKAVLVEYLTRGVPAVARLDPTRAVLWRAMKALEDRGRPFPDLDAWARERFGVGFGDGPRAPRPGARRVYKAQKGNDAQRPYGKIPLGTLGIVAGDRFAVEFVDDEAIVIRRQN